MHDQDGYISLFFYKNQNPTTMNKAVFTLTLKSLQKEIKSPFVMDLDHSARQKKTSYLIYWGANSGLFDIIIA